MRTDKLLSSRKSLICIVAILCALLCGTLAASFGLSGNITTELRENAYDSLMDASEIIRQTLDSSMQDDMELVDAFGRMLHDTEYRDLQSQLAQLCKVDKLLHAYYVDKTGRGMDETGAAIDAARLPVQETALQGRASVSTGFLGETGQQHLIIQAPILDGDDVVGALYGEVVATRYYSEAAFVFLGGEGRASLFNREDGTFVIKAPQTGLTYLKTDNIFEAVQRSDNDAAVYHAFREKVGAGDKSIIRMQYGSVTSYIAILPCKTNSDLCVATIISKDALQVEADSIGRLIFLMQAILILGLCGLIVLGSLLIYRMMREEQARQARELAERSREEMTVALVQAQEASVAKTQFLSNMSHDIRTPMNAIIGMTTLASQNTDDEGRLRECLSVIASSAHHLLDLINDILDMSKIESGNLSLVSEPFALPVAVRSIASIISPLCRAKKQRFSVELKHIEHEFVIGDRTKLGQVLMNLLNNANKFTPEGGSIRLAVEELPTVDPDRAVYCFSVIDNGIGIAKEDQAHVFDAFIRADNVSSGGTEGSGLGLAIAKSIVRAMDGSLELESELGAGTTFTVSLSLPVQTPRDIAEAYIRLKDRRVLVAGGGQALCARICADLAEVGVAAEPADPPQQAETLARRARASGRAFDLALVDLDAPGAAKAGTIRRIREALGAGVPIVLLTADDAGQTEAAAQAAGANALLSGPLYKSCLYDELLHRFEERALHEKTASILAGRRVLLVEDNTVNQAVAKRLLEGAGAAVDIAGDGREGVDAFLASAPGWYDAILMDIQMPVLSGYEATAIIRKSAHPDAVSIPIVALTANAFAEGDEAAAGAGMNAYLTKPIEPRAMFDTLKRFIGD